LSVVSARRSPSPPGSSRPSATRPACPRTSDGLHRLAESVHRGLHLVHVGRKAVDDLPGELVGCLSGELIEAFPPCPPDEEVILPQMKEKLRWVCAGIEREVWTEGAGGSN